MRTREPNTCASYCANARICARRTSDRDLVSVVSVIPDERGERGANHLMTRRPRVLLHSKHMQKTALKAEENTRKKGDHIRATKNPGRAGRAAKCRCRPAATLSRRWDQVLRIKPLDLVIGELRHASVRDHGLATLGKLEVEPDPQACPILTTAHRA